MSQGPHIVQVNVSDGGVPKLPIGQGEVTTTGILGDRQRDTEHHGGPQRAICLLAAERIEALQAEGHPIVPGGRRRKRHNPRHRLGYRHPRRSSEVG